MREEDHNNAAAARCTIYALLPHRRVIFQQSSAATWGGEGNRSKRASARSVRETENRNAGAEFIALLMTQVLSAAGGLKKAKVAEESANQNPIRRTRGN